MSRIKSSGDTLVGEELKAGFSDRLYRQASLFKALAHPARLAILYHLSEMESCMTGDVAGELPLSRTTVGQHLKELRGAGLIKGTVEGVRKNYCLSPSGIKALKVASEELLSRIDTEEAYC